MARKWLTRYRPYVALVAAVALVVLVPRMGDEGTTSAITAGGSGRGPTGAATIAGGAAGAERAPGSVAPAGGTLADAASPDSASADAGETSASYPGIGTPAALANPHCDPKTGRIRFPSLFAPECVVPWPDGADNGGATATGVTKDAITIVMWLPPPIDPKTIAGNAATQSSPDDVKAQALETLSAFADNYELWGRKLEVHFVEASGRDEAAQRADAVAAYNKYKPFLATGYLAIGGTTPTTWSNELAARGVITWDEVVPFDEAHAQPGLRWGYNPDDRMSALHLGEYVAKRLSRRPAKWAGDPAMQPQTRSFGLIYDDLWDKETFDRTFARFGGTGIADAVSFHDTDDVTSLQNQALTQITRMRGKNINNIIVVAGPTYTGLLTKAASQQNFRPEWTMSGWKLQDTAVTARLFVDQSQWAHAFGIGLVPPLETPVSISERSKIIEWATGHQPNLAATNGQVYLLAKSIIAGFHLAGPRLTPASFRDAMFRMKPKGGRWCGCVLHNGMSFGRQLPAYPWEKYFDVDDFAEKWWDPNAVGEDEVGLSAPGRYFVVGGGQRYGPGDWPSTEPDVFNHRNAAVGYSQQPPADRWPEYPPPKRR
jgi:hypothetical protein